LDDGMSINALGKALGVSRQLISRYVNIIRKDGS
jgi:biotin operon repressor